MLCLYKNGISDGVLSIVNVALTIGCFKVLVACMTGLFDAECDVFVLGW